MLKKSKSKLVKLLLAASLVVLPVSSTFAESKKPSYVSYNISKHIGNYNVGLFGALMNESSVQLKVNAAKDRFAGEARVNYDFNRGIDSVDFMANYDFTLNNYLSAKVYSEVIIERDSLMTGNVKTNLSTRNLSSEISLNITQGFDKTTVETGRIVDLYCSVPVLSSDKSSLFVNGNIEAINNYYGSETGFSYLSVGGSFSTKIKESINFSIFGNYRIPLDRKKFPMDEESKIEVSVKIDF